MGIAYPAASRPATPLAERGPVAWKLLKHRGMTTDMGAMSRNETKISSLVMRQRTNQLLYTYWNDVRGKRMAPRRFDIEPARIATILPETFILEQQDDCHYRFRLAGTQICEQFGGELKNYNFLHLVARDDRLTVEDRMSVIAERGAVGLFEFETIAIGGQTGRMEVVVLPLTDAANAPTRFLGAMSAYDVSAWPGHGPTSLRCLIRSELIWPDGRPHSVTERDSAQAPPPVLLPAARVVRMNERQFRVFDGGRSSDI